ncbi:MAG TPA: alpha/beta hydrolase [Acidimicrobiia bacterium]|nr:alpha/beta hydrolase [Acidimicrobiia bacterium]
MKRLLWLLVIFRLLGPVLSPRFRAPQAHPWPLPGRTVFVGDREFVVRQTGPEDAPDIVLIHGLGGSALTEWYEVGPLLAERFRVTLIEHRNHGSAARFVGRYDIDDLADDTAGVLTAAGVDRATVVGYSMGGTIAQALAHRHPRLADRLVLIGTFAAHPRSWRVARQIGTYVVRAWERLTGLGTPEVRAGYLILTGAVEKRYARWMWEETHRRDVDGGAAASLALMRYDASGWLSSIDVPTLIVVPTRDQLVPTRWQYDMGSMIPGARIVDIAGGRHELPWTHPERVAAEIDRFVSSPADRGSAGA